MHIGRFAGRNADLLNRAARPEWHYVYAMKADLAAPAEETEEEFAIREQRAALRDRVEMLIKAACWNKCGLAADEGVRNA